MDWDCWHRAFSAIYRNPPDAKQELKGFHHQVVSTTHSLVSHEASVTVLREWRSSGSDEEAEQPRGRPPTTASYD